MEWTQIKPYDDDAAHMMWISGIYKVRTYDGVRFHAYYIKDSDRNWGWHPSPAPNQEQGYPSRFWPSLESAQQACEQHAGSYIPKPRTVQRAAELLAEFLATPAAA